MRSVLGLGNILRENKRGVRRKNERNTFYVVVEHTFTDFFVNLFFIVSK